MSRCGGEGSTALELQMLFSDNYKYLKNIPKYQALAMSSALLGCIPGAFWLYAVNCFLGYIYIKLKLPETRNKSLEEVEKDFMK